MHLDWQFTAMIWKSSERGVVLVCGSRRKLLGGEERGKVHAWHSYGGNVEGYGKKKLYISSRSGSAELAASTV
jgi:hypothetical protein